MGELTGDIEVNICTCVVDVGCQHLVAFAIGVARRGNRAVATVEGG